MNPSDLWPWLLGAWTLLGAAYSATVTPGGRLLRGSADPENRPALLTAHFALSHLCWLVAYPIAGFLEVKQGMLASFAGMGALALAGATLAYFVWPLRDPEVLPHSHPNLTPDHPHLRQGHGRDGPHHAFVIDDLHPHWPGRG